MSNLTYREKELYFCLNRMEQYYIKLNEKSLTRKISDRKLDKILDQLYMWEEVTDLMLLELNSKTQK